MKGLLKNSNSLDLIKLGLLSMALFPILPNRLKSIPLLLLLGIAIFYFVFEKNRTFNWKLFTINSSVFLVYITTLVYTTNTNYAISKLETAVSLLLYPLIFGLIWKSKNKINKEKFLNKFLYLFFCSVFIYTLIVFVYLIYIGLFKYYKDPNFFRYFTEVIPFIGQHSIYASIFLGLGLLSSVKILQNNKSITQKAIILLGNLLFTLLLVSLASKGVILAIFITSITYIILQVKDIKKSMFVIGAIISLLIIGIICSPSLSKRINLYVSNMSSNSISFEDKLSSTQIRKEIYICSINLIKENWLIGHGLGDVNDSLMQCYRNTSDTLVKGNYNTHNQYLGILLGSGLVGLFLFIYFLFFNYKVAINNKNYLYFSILLFYSIVMLMENVIERRSGVVMFSFLVNFLYFLSSDGKKISNRIG